MPSPKTLDKAKKYLRARRFPSVIALLEPLVLEYRESFVFFYILGTACLYVGDAGGAETYFKRARAIRLRDSDLQLAFVALFMRKGEIDRAVEYCLDVLDFAPKHTRARKYLHLIRKYGEPEIIEKWTRNGKIKRFYPPLGLPTQLFPILCICIVFSACIRFLPVVLKPAVGANGTRADLTALMLSFDEKKSALETDMSAGVYKYILNAAQVSEIYDRARASFQKYNDNEAQKDINMLMNSNASPAVKKKARLLMEYLEEPTFDSYKGSLSYKTVAADPSLYLDCWVVWSGRISNVLSTPELYEFDLLAGYETMERVDGIVRVSFPPLSDVNPQLPVKVLGRISIKDGRLHITGKSMYQSISEHKN